LFRIKGGEKMFPNKNFGQQMQQQQQKQMQQMQQRQREMGWYKKQQDDLRRQQEEERKAAERAASQGQPVSGAPVFRLDSRFAQVEEQVKKLRQDLAAGKINLKKFQAKAQELMIQDSQGFWWMVGSESGAWYRYDGASWMQATPPGTYVGVLSPSGGSSSAGVARKRAPLLGRLWNAGITLVFGIALTAITGFAVGEFIDSTYGGDTAPMLIALVVWGVGLWITVKLARKEWSK
jgi:hypothetical protein